MTTDYHTTPMGMAPLKAPLRSGVAPQGWSSPGLLPATVSSIQFAAGALEFTPINLFAVTTFDLIAAEVTVPFAASTFRLGIYAADKFWQPTGPPLVDTGNLSSAAAGLIQKAINITLPPAHYLSVMHTSALTTFRCLSGICIDCLPIDQLIGPTPYNTLWGGTQAYGPLADPSPLWTSTTPSTIPNDLFSVFIRPNSAT